MLLIRFGTGLGFTTINIAALTGRGKGKNAVATIVCDKDGNYKTTTNHHSVGRGAAWGMLWGLLFGCLF
jgi:hypothetical protein